MNIACVLRKSKDFGPEHVTWLRKQCEEFIPHDRFICYSDTPVDCERVKLTTDWPAWWAKMEIYGDEIPGPLLILDLDTVIRNRFEPTKEQLGSSWVMRHFTRDGFSAPEEICCGVMLVTEQFRIDVFEHFTDDAFQYMHAARGDDQKYFKKYWSERLRRFQDEFLDAFVSYKLHVVPHGLRDDAVFVNFHGIPRPWDIRAPWIPELNHG